MKTKLFLAAMAAVAVIGCQKEPNASVQNADGNASFMKVDLRAAGTMTKAAPGTFEYGTEAENAVSSVTFYFFKDGQKYVVQGTDNYMTGNVDAWTPQGTAGDQFNGATEGNLTIEDISGLILVIKQHANPDDLPNQMVAILNAPAALKASMTLAELEAKVVTSLKEGENFIMSNSVYVDGNNAHINYTSISKDNLFTANLEEGQPGYNTPGTIIGPDDAGYGAASAQGKPVEIYVERVAAKVRVSGITENGAAKRLVVKKSSESADQLTITRIKGYENGNAVTEEVPVYAKVLGWDVTNTKNDAYVLKALEETWVRDTDFGFTPWTSADFHRSYWAKSTPSDPVHAFTFKNLIGKNLANGYQYYFENTAAYNAEGNGVDHPNNNTLANQASQLLVAVQLLAVNGETEKALNVARWYDKYYTIEALQAAMVNTINTKLFKKVGENETITPIAAEDVVFAQVADTEESDRYRVVLSAKDGFAYVDVAGNAMSADAVNAILTTVDPAQMWFNGYAYYYTTIEHFGTAKGIIRNHLYDIAIQNISGLGTPVYDPEGTITPEKPEDLEAYNLSARINILAWHVVSNNVTLN